MAGKSSIVRKRRRRFAGSLFSSARRFHIRFSKLFDLTNAVSFYKILINFGANNTECKPLVLFAKLDRMDVSPIKNLVAAGYVKQAFQELDRIKAELSSESQNEFLLLQSQFSAVEKHKTLNLEDGSARLNRIIYGFIGLLSEIETRTKEERLTRLPDADIGSIVILSEARLLYQFHKPVFSIFQAADRQISAHLDANRHDPSDIQMVRYSLDELLALKDQIDRLQELVEVEKEGHGDPHLIKMAADKISYLQNEMTLAEAAQQSVQLRKLMNRFKRNAWAERLPLFLIGAVLLGLLVFTGVKLLNLI